jgi:putative ABC transport system ATP-binding protein
LLDRVSLAIRAGERLALAGPSGAGKTLLLRALAVLDPVDGGEVHWHGRIVRRDLVPSFRWSVVYLHQRAALLEDTVEAALRRPFSLKVRRNQRYDPQRAVELLGQLGRDPEFLRKGAADLSGGEIQITALIRAIQLGPSVLLLDEPTAALDSTATAAVEGLVGRWIAEAPQERALIWVSHNTEQARRVAEKVISMQDGRIADGT